MGKKKFGDFVVSGWDVFFGDMNEIKPFKIDNLVNSWLEMIYFRGFFFFFNCQVALTN